MPQKWSFDGTEVVSNTVVRPENYNQLFAQLHENDQVIALGSGLSYCHAGVGEGVVSISSKSFDRILGLDSATGIIEVESGVSVGKLLRVALKHGWYPPVLPGHPAITVGGCVGFNVHGKSQFHSDNFESCVLSLRLYHPYHGHLSCSPEERSELFRATVGGFGLTGFVTSIVIQLVPLKGKSLSRRAISVCDLEESVTVMEAHESSADAVYSWNNLRSTSSSFGSGLVYVERFSEFEEKWPGRFHDLDPESRRSFRLCPLNRATIPIMNGIYRFNEKRRSSTIQLAIETGTFPINGKEIYFKLFGRKGLREYQALVPRQMWHGFSEQVRTIIGRHHVSPTLGSLKLFRGKQSLLKFNGSGVCFTIDVVADHRANNFFEDLDRLVLDVGGIVNLSKDSRIQRESVRAMFPEYDLFREFAQDFDKDNRFSSNLRRRIIG